MQKRGRDDVWRRQPWRYGYKMEGNACCEEPGSTADSRWSKETGSKVSEVAGSKVSGDGADIIGDDVLSLARCLIRGYEVGGGVE